MSDVATSTIADAHEAFKCGDLQTAERICREVLARSPEDVSTLGLLGTVLHALERYDEAERVFARLADLEPSQALHWMNVGTARRCQGHYEDALVAFGRAASLGADSPDFFYNLALVHIDRNDFESARAVLAKARVQAPQDAEIVLAYAQCCYERQDADEAVDVLTSWRSFEGLTPKITTEIGLLLMKLGVIDQAEPAIRRAAEADSADPELQLALAQLLERINRVDEAESVAARLKRDLQTDRLGTDLHVLMGTIAQRQGNHQAAIEEFSLALDRCKTVERRHFYEFPRARSLDSLGRFDEAFSTLLDAHHSQVEHVRLTAPLVYVRGAPTMGITRFGCDPSDVSAWHDAGAPTIEKSPVFIVAFPRSGTTLLELSLDAHPLLRSMDEQPYLQDAIDDMLAKGVRYPAELSKLSTEELTDIRERYWQRASRRVVLQPGQRLIDKNPLNLMRLPAIRRLFPNARIILAVRHPCDVILSCYMQHFRAPDFVLLCRNLQSLADGYRRAFDFWYQQAAILRPCVYELRYETLVEEFAAQTRRLMNFLELPWDDSVLKPAAHALEKKFISTPSYSQVVRPVNNKAVGRWLGYREHFLEVLPILQPYCDRWGYAS